MRCKKALCQPVAARGAVDLMVVVATRRVVSIYALSHGACNACVTCQISPSVPFSPHFPPGCGSSWSGPRVGSVISSATSARTASARAAIKRGKSMCVWGGWGLARGEMLMRCVRSRCAIAYPLPPRLLYYCQCRQHAYVLRLLLQIPTACTCRRVLLFWGSCCHREPSGAAGWVEHGRFGAHAEVSLIPGLGPYISYHHTICAS